MRNKIIGGVIILVAIVGLAHDGKSENKNLTVSGNLTSAVKGAETTADPSAVAPAVTSTPTASLAPAATPAPTPIAVTPAPAAKSVPVAAKPIAVASTPTPTPTPAASTASCNPNYTPCIPNSSTDLNCPDIRTRVTVIGTDVYRLDGDHDGIGCESY